MRGLYAIVDLQTLALRGIDPLAFSAAILTARPAALQVRAKEASAREIVSLLRALGPSCRRAGVPLVANDRPDLAELSGCGLVHVGQTDMPIERVRRVTPRIRVGISTHDFTQLDAALEARPAYVAFGPVFETSSKANADPVVGTAALEVAYTRALDAGIPLVAVGGITRARAGSLVGLADAIAVIGDLVPPRPADGGAVERIDDVLTEVAQRARMLHDLFEPAPPIAVEATR
jgi:thiamine-phosphate pyrophosphorylase